MDQSSGWSTGQMIRVLSPAREDIFLFSAHRVSHSRLPEAVTRGVKWPRRGADRFPASTVEVKNTWSCAIDSQELYSEISL